MAKDQSAKVMARRMKTPPQKSAVSTKTPGASQVQTPAAPRRRTTPAQFWTEVRTEARKITWTSWKETWITSVMVALMVVITSVFFMIVDGSLNFLVTQLLKLASG